MANRKKYAPKGMPQRITKCMEKENINAVLMAKILGLERKTIYSYQNGTSVPTADVIAEMCKRFDVSADWLIFGDK